MQPRDTLSPWRCNLFADRSTKSILSLLQFEATKLKLVDVFHLCLHLMSQGGLDGGVLNFQHGPQKGSGTVNTPSAMIGAPTTMKHFVPLSGHPQQGTQTT
eukprot:5478598-Amphidinium_carterae.2